MNKSFISLTFSASVICLLSFALAQSVSAEALYDVWKKHSQRQPYNGYSNNSAPIDPALASPTKPSQSKSQQSPTPASKAETKTEPTTTVLPVPAVTENENTSTPTLAPIPPLTDTSNATESTSPTTPPAILEETVETIVTPEEVITVEETIPSDENGLPNILNPFPPQASDDDPEFYSDEVQILRTPENTPEALQELLEEERRLREMNSLDDAIVTPDYEEILSQ